MTYSAVALVRLDAGGEGAWAASEVDLDEADDLDALLDLLDDVATQQAALAADERADDAPVVVLVEEDDEWLGVIRVDGPEVRVFLSDRRAALSSDVAERFFSDAAGVEIVDPDVEPDDLDLDADDLDASLAGTPEPTESDRPEVQPGGDADLLADLGTPGPRLVALCAGEGRLPADVLGLVAEAAGAGEVFEEARSA